MKTIRYYIINEGGLRAVAGAPVTIENDQGMTFALHCNADKPFDDPRRYVGTHLESGMLAGSGSMPSVAIENARARITKSHADGTLEGTVKQAMHRRAEMPPGFAT